MKSLSELAQVTVLTALGTLLLVVGKRSFNISSTRLCQDAVAQTTPVPTLTPRAFLPIVMGKWPPVLLLSDEFDGNGLDLTKWDLITGTVSVANGKLIFSDAEIQSKALFQHGILEVAIESSDWKPQDQFTDSSFGFEGWYGECHYGTVFKANGHLGVLQKSNCPDLNEEYPPIPNWNDRIQVIPTVFYLTLTWSPSGVTLFLSDGSSYTEVITGTLVPTVPLNIRLNSYWDEPHPVENYIIDYIKVYQDP